MKDKKARRIVYKILSYKRKKVLQKANKLKGKDILVDEIVVVEPIRALTGSETPSFNWTNSLSKFQVRCCEGERRPRCMKIKHFMF